MNCQMSTLSLLKIPDYSLCNVGITDRLADKTTQKRHSTNNNSWLNYLSFISIHEIWIFTFKPSIQSFYKGYKNSGGYFRFRFCTVNIWVFKNPYNKVTGCLSVCMFVPKDLANRWTDRILLNMVASHRSSQEGFQLFLGRVPPASKRNHKKKLRRDLNAT